MKPAKFTFHRPGTLPEALAAYAQADDGKILAGGQSLVPLLSMRLATVEELIDINGIPELSFIDVDASGVRFGATARHTELLEHEDVVEVQPMIPAALRHVAHPTIRNRGTTVGSIVHADAAGEMPMVFALLGGTLTVQSVRGSREIATDDLFLGALETSLAPDEIATEVFLPALGPAEGVAFEEVARRHGDYALCGVGAIVGVDDRGAVRRARAGYVSVSDVPVALDFGEAFADGRLSEENLAAAGEQALAELDPGADIHASAEYRSHLVRVLTARALRSAHEHAIARQTKDA